VSLPNPGHIHRWLKAVLAERVMTLAGPDVAVIRIRPHPDADEPGQKIWRASVLNGGRRRVRVNKAVSQILAQLIRDHFPSVDWSREWDYHLPEHELREPVPGSALVSVSRGVCHVCRGALR
jgi:hypothetical protein